MEVSAIKIVGLSSHSVGDELGGVHIRGGFIAQHETLCGYVDTFLEYEDTSEPVTCAGCKEIYESIKSSRKRIKFDC